MIETLNLWATQWAAVMWKVTWQSGILVAAVFLIKRVFKRMSPTLGHFLWTLVLLKFLITPFLTVPITVHVKAPPDVIAAVRQPESPPPPAEIKTNPAPLQANTEESNKPPQQTLNLYFYLFSAWAIGAAVLLFVIIRSFAKIRMQLATAQPLQDETIRAVVQRGVQALKIRTPEIKVSDKFSSPLVGGIIRPVLIIPSKILTMFQPAELESVIIHELAHIRRRDILTNWLQIFIQTVYFFNPLVWYTNRQIRLAREQACDDWVLQVNNHQRERYADILVKVTEYCSTRGGKFALSIIGISQPFSFMAGRIKMVMDTGRTISTRISLKALLVLLAVGFPIMPAYAITRKPIKEKLLALQENTVPAEPTGDTLYQQGVNLCNQEKYAEAIPLLEEAAKQKANFAEAYYQLGICYLKTKQFDKAKQNLISAKVLSPNKELADKAASLIAAIPGEIEKDRMEREKEETEKKKLQEEAELKKKENIIENTVPVKSNTDVFSAAAAGDMKTVKLLLAENHNLVNARNNNGWTPLHVAALFKKKNVAELLLANGADVNAKSNNGETPLQVAEMSSANNEVGELLYKHGGTGSRGGDFAAAVKWNDIKTVKSLLAGNPNLVNAKDNNGWTPLHWAAEYDRKEVAKLLLANGADVNAKDNSGWTPLYRTVFIKEHKDVAKVLLANRADVNAKDNNGTTPLHVAAGWGCNGVAELLLANGADVNAKDKWGRTPLHEAAAQKQQDTVELLLAHGADINAKDQYGWTPLYAVIRLNDRDISGTLKTVKVLLAHKADVNARDNEDNTPLHLAMQQNNQDLADLLRQHGGITRSGNIFDAATAGNIETVKLLLAATPDLINARNRNGETPLHLAAGRGYKDVVKVLLVNGADVDAKDNIEWTPLHRAAQNGRRKEVVEVAELLLAHGADVNAKNKWGRPPLHPASVNNFRDMITLLVSHGADVNAKDENGWSPLHWAAQNGKEKDVAELLLAKGADVNAKTNTGLTPLRIALSANRTIIALLRQHGGVE